MKNPKKLYLLIIWLLIAVAANSTLAENFPAQIKKPISEAVAIRQSSQKKTDKWVMEQEKLKARYKALMFEKAELSARHDDILSKVTAKKNIVADLAGRVLEIGKIADQLLPFLNKIDQRLVEMLDNDLPFLKTERQTRLKTLHKILADPQISQSEKFRKTMEALFIEAEYGNTVEVYQDKIIVENKEIIANIFRLGRISIFFQSPDKKLTGYYDSAKDSWMVLPKQQNRSINTAIEIAAKRQSAKIISLPLGRMALK